MHSQTLRLALSQRTSVWSDRALSGAHSSRPSASANAPPLRKSCASGRQQRTLAATAKGRKGKEKGEWAGGGIEENERKERPIDDREGARGQFGRNERKAQENIQRHTHTRTTHSHRRPLHTRFQVEHRRRRHVRRGRGSARAKLSELALVIVRRQWGPGEEGM